MYSSLCNKIYNFGTRKSNTRVEKITKITPHHMAGNLDPYNCAKWHCNGDREASANYYIGTDGTIVGGVDENRRAWTSSSGWNDQKAITIEVANNSLAPNWTISDKAYASLVKLCADICKRYGITPKYDGTKNGSVTTHDMYASTLCPGPYLKNIITTKKFENDVIKAMGGVQPTPKEDEMKFKDLKILYYDRDNIIKDDSVRVVQSIVIPEEIDGSFGPRTEKAVKNFQKKKGIVVDGEVGPITWEKIFNECR